MNQKRITRDMYDLEPDRYSLLPGDSPGAPACPYGNSYRWVGFDKQTGSFVRFTKSVFKFLVNQQSQAH